MLSLVIRFALLFSYIIVHYWDHVKLVQCPIANRPKYYGEDSFGGRFKYLSHLTQVRNLQSFINLQCVSYIVGKFHLLFCCLYCGNVWFCGLPSSIHRLFLHYCLLWNVNCKSHGRDASHS